jgi:SAM-dependent methyltransferase
MGRWSRRLAPLFLHYAGVTDGACVLDVGCGTGSLTFALACNPRIGFVQGIDYSAAYVQHARSQAAGDSRLAFQVGDACALPFPDGSFDHAVSSLALQFIPEAHRAVQEMRRVTCPGGTVAATTWDSRGGLVIFRMFFDTAAVLDPKASERRANACTRPLSRCGGMAAAWREAGLVDVIEDTLAIRMDYASFTDFWTPIEGNDGPYADYLRTLDAGRKAVLRELIRAAYLDGDSDGPRSYAATAWAVKGKVP